jgi:hypothetical protein
VAGSVEKGSGLEIVRATALPQALCAAGWARNVLLTLGVLGHIFVHLCEFFHLCGVVFEGLSEELAVIHGAGRELGRTGHGVHFVSVGFFLVLGGLGQIVLGFVVVVVGEAPVLGWCFGGGDQGEKLLLAETFSLVVVVVLLRESCLTKECDGHGKCE